MKKALRSAYGSSAVADLGNAAFSNKDAFSMKHAMPSLRPASHSSTLDRADQPELPRAIRQGEKLGGTCPIALFELAASPAAIKGAHGGLTQARVPRKCLFTQGSIG